MLIDFLGYAIFASAVCAAWPYVVPPLVDDALNAWGRWRKRQSL